MKNKLKILIALAAFAGFFSAALPSAVRADDDGGLRAPAGAPERKKQIQFEDELVEGMNHNPFDSLEHIANQDMRDSSHLYKKKPHFRVEMKQQVREAGYTE
jgi:hypothetical protein